MNFNDNPADADESDNRFSRLNDFAWVFFFTKNTENLTLTDMANKLLTPVCLQYVTGSSTESKDPKDIAAAKREFLGLVIKIWLFKS